MPQKKICKERKTKRLESSIYLEVWTQVYKGNTTLKIISHFPCKKRHEGQKQNNNAAFSNHAVLGSMHGVSHRRSLNPFFSEGRSRVSLSQLYSHEGKRGKKHYGCTPGSLMGQKKKAWGSLKKFFGVCTQWATFIGMNGRDLGTHYPAVLMSMVIAVPKEHPGTCWVCQLCLHNLHTVFRFDDRAGTVSTLIMIIDSRCNCIDPMIRCFIQIMCPYRLHVNTGWNLSLSAICLSKHKHEKKHASITEKKNDQSISRSSKSC